MFRPPLMAAALACAIPFLSFHAHADADIDALRAELQQLKQSYEARIQALETRLQQAETQSGSVTKTPDSTPAPTIEAVTEPTGMTQTASRFNPDISLILQGQYAHLDDIEHRNITGFLSAGDTALPRGLSLAESELILSASIDPYFGGYLNVALDPDGGVGVEEAWFETTSLGNGTTLKAGRFLSALGYQNPIHPHAWDFTTNNLMYEAAFGGAYSQDGVQAKWVAPTDLFIEFGAEIGNGNSFPSTDNNSNGWGDYTLFSHIGGDLGVSHSWTAGLAYLQGKAKNRESELADLNAVWASTYFTGTSKNWITNLVWKWAPEGNASEQNVKLVAEYFWRDEAGSLRCADNTAEGGACTGLDSDYTARQSGGYLQGVYQFMPRWRVGYRYDRLNDGNYSFGVNNAALPVYRDTPSANTLMLDYSPSEFSRFRLQYTQSQSMIGITENQYFIQYIQSLGAHGAHPF